jgi:hypothetical protein
MGGGRRVYLLEMSKQQDVRDLADTFGEARPDPIGTVAEQEHYYAEWLRSIGLITTESE